MSDVLPAPTTSFGRLVRDRLRDERIVGFTPVGSAGTPQTIPLWFIWNEDDDPLVTYNLPSAYRMAHVDARPAVALHFNSDSQGGEVVVLRGRAERAPEIDPPDQSEQYLAKYRDAMAQVAGSVETFAATYSAPVRIRLTKVRGF